MFLLCWGFAGLSATGIINFQLSLISFNPYGGIIGGSTCKKRVMSSMSASERIPFHLGIPPGVPLSINACSPATPKVFVANATPSPSGNNEGPVAPFRDEP